ncbi:MAG: hypothetical protein RQ864_11785 [Lutibacter sp.]|nr:hypothetical protein [Lutibacter sp.]
MKIAPLLKSSINYLKLLSEKHNYNHPNYYNRKFDEAHQKINITELDINKNKIINQVHLQNLCNRYSFINNVLELRFDTNDLNIYRNSTIEIIKSYLENLYIDNVDYGDDIFKTKDYSRANNIISSKRKEVLNDLSDILLYIEIHIKSIVGSEEKIVYSNLKNNNPVQNTKDIEDLKDLFQKPYTDIMELLIENKILDKQKKWPKDETAQNAAKLIQKLIEVNIITIPNGQIIILLPIISKSLNVTLEYGNTTAIFKKFRNDEILRKKDFFYKKLSFLDKYKN